MFDPDAMSCVSPNTVENCAGITTSIEEPETSKIRLFSHTVELDVLLVARDLKIYDVL